jgi:hypothetical protein
MSIETNFSDDLVDQSENAGREREALRIANLLDDKRDAAIDHECAAQVIHQFIRHRQRPGVPNGSAVRGDIAWWSVRQMDDAWQSPPFFVPSKAVRKGRVGWASKEERDDPARDSTSVTRLPVSILS